MASKLICCTIVIFACVVLAGLARADDPPKTACKDAVATAFNISEIKGLWYEIQRKNLTNAFDSGFQCVNVTFNPETNTTGKVIISRSREQDHKLVGDTINSNFTIDNENNIKFMVNNAIIKIKILTSPSNFVVSCGFADLSTDAQAWIFSKSRDLKDEDKKGVKEFVKNLKDFDSLVNVEQNEKKCSGAGSVVPIVSVLALTLFTVLKAF